MIFPAWARFWQGQTEPGWKNNYEEYISAHTSSIVSNLIRRPGTCTNRFKLRSVWACQVYLRFELTQTTPKKKWKNELEDRSTGRLPTIKISKKPKPWVMRPIVPQIRGILSYYERRTECKRKSSTDNWWENQKRSSQKFNVPLCIERSMAPKWRGVGLVGGGTI